jgi:hypothetical protein
MKAKSTAWCTIFSTAFFSQAPLSFPLNVAKEKKDDLETYNEGQILAVEVFFGQLTSLVGRQSDVDVQSIEL